MSMIGRPRRGFNVIAYNQQKLDRQKLKCPSVGRDKDCVTALQFYFSRPVTDDEMRFLHEVMQRAAETMPTTLMEDKRV